MRLSLRYRLLIPLAVLLAADAAATGWAASAAAGHADRRIADQLRAVARTLAEPPTFPLTPRVLEQMKGLSGAEFLLEQPGGRRTGTFPEPQPDPSDDISDDFSRSVTLGESEYHGLRFPLRSPHPNSGGTLFIFYPEDQRRTAVRDAARPLLLLGAGGGLVAVGLTAVAGTGLVRRVQSLDRQARAIAEGDFRSSPLPVQDDELRDLAGSVNEMARRLAEYRDALATSERLRVLGQFSGGLAHQLRNAAAGAKLALQLHQDECPATDREPLDVALRQLARIESMVRQFLELGRPAAGAHKPCDLRTVIGQAVALLGPQCRHTGTRLFWDEPPEPKMVSGDPTQLGHLFGNLIGNAVEAAGPGGEVGVALADGPVWRVEVSDTGPGPPSELVDRLFDPFVTGKDQGIGLGLAVAKQVADFHSGRITWKRRDERTVFRVELPAG